MSDEPDMPQPSRATYYNDSSQGTQTGEISNVALAVLQAQDRFPDVEKMHKNLREL